MKLLLATLTILAVATAPAIAQWSERDDAGDLPATAQTPVGVGSLTTISGSISAASDADMYCIRITDPTIFDAATCGMPPGITDSQLFLFNSAGFGIVANDDGGCGLLSRITNALVASQPPGNYWLAISRYSRDPISPGGLIFAGATNIQQTPTGPGGGQAISGWQNSSPQNGTYQITLAGCAYCGLTAVEPTTWGNIKSVYR